MKKLIILTILLIIIVTLLYFSTGIVTPDHFIVIKKKNGKTITFSRSGIYLHFPFVEKHLIYPKNLKKVSVSTSIVHGKRNYKINLLLYPQIEDPEKIFPWSEKKLLKKVVNFYQKKFSLPVTSFIKNPPSPVIPGLKLKIFVKKITPFPETEKKGREEIIVMLKELTEKEKRYTTAKIKEIMSKAENIKKSIITKAKIEKMDLIQSAMTVETRELSTVKFPELWLLLKKLEIYSSINTDVTLYLNFPQETIKGGR